MLVCGPFRRFLSVVTLLVGAVVIVAGGLQLGGPGVVAVAVAGVLIGGTCAGMAREMPGRSSRSPIEVGALCAAATIGGLFLLAGVVALAGGVVAALVVVGGMAVAIAYVLLRHHRPAPAGVPEARPSGALQPMVRPLPPVSSLSTEALGREWVLSTAALGVRLDPATRQSIVHRRQAALDELERRDPVGFARWIASGPRPGSDPADYVRDRPAADTDAA